MASSQGCSSCSNKLSKGSPRSSHGGGWRGGGLIPVCYCGDIAVTKVARTIKNGGRSFWGCPHYKAGCSSGSSCNFFKWCSEEDVDEKDCTIARQRRFISDLQNVVKGLQKKMKFVVVALFVSFVLNLVMLSFYLG